MSAECHPRSTPGDGDDTRRARLVADLAERQWGVISLAQLIACGLSRTTVIRWVADGRLHRVARGVYAVGHRTLTARGWWMVAVLACGDGTLLSHRAGLAVYGAMSPVSRIDVIVPGRRGGGLPGIAAHRCVLPEEEKTTFHGLPVTTISRAFLDAAPRLSAEQLAMALNEAVHLERYDHEEMMATLARHPGHRGIRRVREALAVAGDEALRFRSRAELRARMVLSAAGVLLPETNAWLPTRAGLGHELDLFWRDVRLNVEIDGPRHALPWQQRKDRLRDADLAALGITVVRVPVDLLDRDPAAFVALVVDALRRVSSPFHPW